MKFHPNLISNIYKKKNCNNTFLDFLVTYEELCIELSRLSIKNCTFYKF